MEQGKSQVQEIEIHKIYALGELVFPIEQVQSLSSKRHTAFMNIHDHYVEFQIDNVSTSNILPTHVYVYLTSDQKFKNL